MMAIFMLVLSLGLQQAVAVDTLAVATLLKSRDLIQ